VKSLYVIAAIFISTATAAYSSLSVTQFMAWPYWSYFVVCMAFGLLSYLISVTLIGAFIERRAPEMATNEEVLPGVQKWELTAGTGVVPQWVTLIGLVSLAFFLAIPFELIARLLR